MLAVILYPQSKGEGTEMMNGKNQHTDADKRKDVVNRSGNLFCGRGKRMKKGEEIQAFFPMLLMVFFPVLQSVPCIGKRFFPLFFPAPLCGSNGCALVFEIKVNPSDCPFSVQGAAFCNAPQPTVISNDSCAR